MAQEKPHSAESQDPQDYRSQNYRIHMGDVLQVCVYKHPELTRKIAVQGDGNHILSAEPKKTQKASAIDDTLGEMQVVGLTAANVATALREKLKPVIADPRVTIIVVETIMKPLPRSEKPSPQLRDTPPPAQKQDRAST